jgi:C4-dicarboxylate transporter, DctQ subunit
MLKTFIRACDAVLTHVEEWTLFVAVIAALCALFINVVLRYGFNYSLAWSEELVRHVIVLTTFVGCSAAVKQRSTIKIDAVVQLVPWLKTPLTVVSHLATLLFAALMLHYGWLTAARQAQMNQKTIILHIPKVYLYAILPVVGGMILLRTLLVMSQDFAHWRQTRRQPPGGTR